MYEGKRVKQTSTKAWYRGLEDSGIKDFRWHDLRHTWASWHVQRGTPLHVLKELGGWGSMEMVLRYAHLAAPHVEQWVQSHTFFERPQHSDKAENVDCNGLIKKALRLEGF